MHQVPRLSLCAVVGMALVCALSQATEAQSRKEQIHKELLHIYLAEKKYRDAQEEYQTLLVIKPGDAQLHYDFGNFLAHKGDYSTSLTHYQQAVKLSPGNADYNGGLGDAFLRIKDYKGAIAAYRRAGSKYGSQLNLALQYQQQLDQLEHYNRQLQRQRDQDQ